MDHKIILLLATLSYTVAYSGYAAPFTNGITSTSSRALFGSRNWKVCYSAEQVNNVGTLLCCKGKGYVNGKETWFQLGCSNNGPVKRCVDWGNNVAYPAIRCSGNPFGTSYKWSF